MSRKYRAKICAVAKEYGETPQQVRKEMQETIRIAYESDDPEVRAVWAKTPFSACPTVEEFLSYISETVREDRKLRILR